MESNNSIAILSSKKIIIALVILVLVFGNIFFAAKYFLQAQETTKLQKELLLKQTNDKVIAFLNLFISKVLESSQPVSFEDRLKLENAIRDLNDPDILAKWEKFTSGTNATEIQQGVKDLLQALANKISY